MQMIIDAIKVALDMKASDVHITEGKYIYIRNIGEIIPQQKYGKIHRDTITKFIEKLVPHLVKRFLAYDNIDSLDFSYTFEEVSNLRVRCQVYHSSSGLSIAMRLLSGKIPKLESLSLPQSVEKFTRMEDGLILFTGVTGSGKSTSLSAIIQRINETRQVNIITVEDPIEYIYTDDKAKIEQREVGNHVSSFDAATRDALRQDPDILLVGEMRDLETIENALRLSETGHLVFGTLHATSVVDSIDRIINVFPENRQNQIRFSLSNSLKGVVSQKLVKSQHGGRIPLCEIMMVDDTIVNFIQKQQDKNSYKDYMRPNKDIGSVHIVDNILWHYSRGSIDIQDIEKLVTPDDLKIIKSNIR